MRGHPPPGPQMPLLVPWASAWAASSIGAIKVSGGKRTALWGTLPAPLVGSWCGGVSLADEIGVDKPPIGHHVTK